VDLNNGRVTFIDEKGQDATCKYSHGPDKDWFTWCTDSGRLTLEWPNGHPFSPNPPTSVLGPGCKHPSVRVANTTPTSYKYNVTLTDVNGVDHEVDPKVIIDPGVFSGKFVAALALIAGFGIGFLFARRWR